MSNPNTEIERLRKLVKLLVASLRDVRSTVTLLVPRGATDGTWFRTRERIDVALSAYDDLERGDDHGT